MKPTFLSHFFSALNALSNAEFAKRTGLQDLTQKLLFHGTKTGVKVGAAAQRTQKEVVSRFGGGAKLSPEDALQRASQGPKHFDLSLTEEQEMTREMLTRFVSDVMLPLAEESEKEGWSPKSFLEEVSELGLHLLGIPEALGGAGGERSPTSHMLIAETMAQGDMGLTVAALAPFGFINALTEFGTHEQQAKYLPPFAEEGFLPAALAMAEPRVRFSPESLQTRALREGRGFRLNGVKSMVPLCEEAEVFLVCADLEGAGPRAFIVESHAEGLRAERERYMGLNNAGMGRLVLEDVWVEQGALLGEQEDLYDHSRLVDLCRIGIAAMAVGTCQSVLSYVVPFCNEREAFGEPISHRQAVAFTVADMAIELEGMRLLVWRAAARAEQSKSFRRETFLAQLQCGEKGMMIGSNGVQMLGGAGFVCDHPVERWYRQLRAISVLEGVFLV